MSKGNFKLFLRKKLDRTDGHALRITEPESASPIIEFVSTVELSATTSNFIARDKFVVNTGRNASVKISKVSGNFDDWFLAGESKVETPMVRQTLCYYRLLKPSLDNQILIALGGRKSAITGLSQAYSLMEKQPNGPRSNIGSLLTDEFGNFFYVPQAVTKLKGGRPSYIYTDKAGRIVTENANDKYCLFKLKSQ